LLHKTNIISPEQEADLFGRYILKRLPSDSSKQLYMKAITTSVLESDKDKKLILFIHGNPWSLGLIDSGLAFIMPYSEIRKRIYIMFSILECNPEYADNFLSKKRNPFYILVILFSGVRGVLKGLLGSMIIKIIV
jgi:hypothetical protein